jgi:hypothetical protein
MPPAASFLRHRAPGSGSTSGRGAERAEATCFARRRCGFDCVRIRYLEKYDCALWRSCGCRAASFNMEAPKAVNTMLRELVLDRSLA